MAACAILSTLHPLGSYTFCVQKNDKQTTFVVSTNLLQKIASRYVTSYQIALHHYARYNITWLSNRIELRCILHTGTHRNVENLQSFSESIDCKRQS